MLNWWRWIINYNRKWCGHGHTWVQRSLRMESSPMASAGKLTLWPSIRLLPLQLASYSVPCRLCNTRNERWKWFAISFLIPWIAAGLSDVTICSSLSRFFIFAICIVFAIAHDLPALDDTNVQEVLVRVHRARAQYWCMTWLDVRQKKSKQTILRLTFIGAVTLYARRTKFSGQTHSHTHADNNRNKFKSKCSKWNRWNVSHAWYAIFSRIRHHSFDQSIFPNIVAMQYPQVVQQ